MRAIALVLLGLLALTAARPACAALTPPATTQEAHATHSGCPEAPQRAAHHACAMASCVGCALGVARLPSPTALIVPAPPAIAATPVVTLAGLGPVAAIPPPRPLA